MIRLSVLIIVGVMVVVGLFYAVENWRGWREWTKEAALVAEQGTPLELAELIPPPVPPEDNLAEVMPFVLLFDFIRDAQGQWVNTNFSVAHAWLDFRSVHGVPNPPSVGKWLGVDNAATNRSINLSEWQAYFRAPVQHKRNDIAAMRHRYGLLPTDSATGDSPESSVPPPSGYPLPAEVGSPAQDVLLALKVFEEQFATLAAGVRRPHARFPIRYGDGPSAWLPHLSLIKRFTTVFTLRGTASLEDGNSASALEDFRSALGLGESVREEPLLISQLVRHACLMIALQIVWEGQVNHRWSDADLQAIEELLRPTDFHPGLQRALAGERCGFLEMVRTIVHSAEGRRMAVGWFEGAPSSSLSVRLSPAYLYWAPRGWLYASAAAFSRSLRQLESTSPDHLHSLIATWPSPTPSDSSRYRFYHVVLAPSQGQDFRGLASIPAKALRAQALARLARTACALERHFLAEGAYPESLESLAPRWLPTLPLDPIDGQPLRYVRESNDRFRLWSVAINARDDGGSMNASDDVPLRSLDWVWSWP